MTANNQEIELEKVESEKELGVIIDQNLTFRAHITSKVNIANKHLGIIFRTFTYIYQEMFLNLYKSIVRPHLEYATPVWSPFYKKRIKYLRMYKDGPPNLFLHVKICHTQKGFVH